MRVNEKPGKRPEAVLLAAGLALLVSTSGAVAAVSAQVVAHGRVETGGVGVSLEALSPGAGSLVTGQRAASAGSESSPRRPPSARRSVT